MSNDIFSEIKSMDKKERRALLEKLSAALTPEQQKQVRSIVQDKKQMEKVQNNLRAEDISNLIDGLKGEEDPRDFLNSPQIQARLREILG
ncbi:MAG: hypothetical protein IJC46_03145 [Clostridia bacterium]|nr:hypothetical protein [Clostridia bacterium]